MTSLPTRKVTDRPRNKVLDRILTGVTVVVAALAVLVGGHRAMQFFSGDSTELGEVLNWETFATGGHRFGPDHAKVTVVIFYDFMCPFCQDAAFALQTLRQRHTKDIAVVYRHAPPSSSISLRFAIGAECAARADRFLPFHDAVMTDPEAMQNDNRQMWAERAEVTDTASFFACLDDPAGQVGIHRDTLAARQLGITGTPTFLINNRMVDGYPGFDRLHQLAREALSQYDDASAGHRPEYELPWQFEELWELGPNNNEFLGESVLPDWAIATDAADNVYIRDLTASTVFVISEHGDSVTSIGRAGAGPGEFCNPESIDVSTGGVLTVLDRCAPGFLRWSTQERRFLGQIRTESVLSFVGRMRVVADDSIIVTEREMLRSSEGATGYAQHVAVWTTTGVGRLHSGAEATRNEFLSPCGGQAFIYPMFFEPTARWDAGDGVLAIASDSAYVIDLFIEGEANRRIERDVDVRQTTWSMIQRHLEAIPVWERAISRWVECGMPAREAITRIGYAPYLQAIADLRIGPDGQVWVRRGHTAYEADEIDVFSRTGKYLGTLPSGSPFPAAFLSSDRIVVARQDEWGASVSVFRISR